MGALPRALELGVAKSSVMQRKVVLQMHCMQGNVVVHRVYAGSGRQHSAVYEKLTELTKNFVEA